VDTELLYLRDAYLVSADAAVVAVEDDRVALDRTVLYPTGGGQPFDTGTLGDARVVGIVGLDKQADGGTHVRSTDEVGRVRVVKTESKGKSNKRIRIEILDG
jgi:Ser-tRNA(Ala) deacylase AlaX